MAPANQRSGACGRPEALAAEARGAALPPPEEAAPSLTAASAEVRRARCRSSDGVLASSSTRTSDQVAGAAPSARQLSQPTSRRAHGHAACAAHRESRARAARAPPCWRRTACGQPRRGPYYTARATGRTNPATPHAPTTKRAAASGGSPPRGSRGGTHLAQRLLQCQLGPARRPRARGERVPRRVRRATTAAHRSSSSAASSVRHSASSSCSIASRSAAISRLPRAAGEQRRQRKTTQHDKRRCCFALARPSEPLRARALAPLTSAERAAAAAC